MENSWKTHGISLQQFGRHPGCDRGDSFPFDFEPNEIPSGSKLKGKLSPRSYAIQCERKWK